MLLRRSAPQAGDYPCSQGDAYSRVGDWEKAKQFYLEALRVNPKHAEACCHLAAVFKRTDRNAAIDFYTQAIQNNPTPAIEAYCGRGTCYLEAGDLERALVDLSEAVRLGPQYPASYVLRRGSFGGAASGTGRWTIT